MTVWKYVSIFAEKRQWLRGYDFVTKRSDLFVTKFSTGVECVCAGASARGISLRNAPRRNPTCATVSPHRAPRTCGPARRRDGSSRPAHAEPNRQESTGIDGSRVCLRGAIPHAGLRCGTFQHFQIATQWKKIFPLAHVLRFMIDYQIHFRRRNYVSDRKEASERLLCQRFHAVRDGCRHDGH